MAEIVPAKAMGWRVLNPAYVWVMERARAHHPPSVVAVDDSDSETEND